MNVRSVAANESPSSRSASHVGAWVWALSSLILGGSALLAAFQDPLAAMLRTWLSSPSFQHGMLVPVVAAVFVWFDRRALARLAPQVWPWGLVLAALAALLAAVGAAASTLVLQQLALVLSLQALAATVLGLHVGRRIAFPLAFLYFAVPFGDVVVPALRDLTAYLSVEILSAFGLTATLDGFLIRLPTADYRVAEACAGLRFLLVGVAIGVLAARLFLRSWRRWTLFLLLAATVPIAANVARAALIIALAEQGVLGPTSIWSHLTYGMGFNAVVVTALLLLAFALRDAPPATAEPPPSQARYHRLGFPVLAIVAIVLPVLGLALGRGESVQSGPVPELPAPVVGAGWQPVAAKDDGWRPRAQGADAELVQAYASGTARVDLYIAFYTRQREGAEVISDANRLTAMGPWRDVGRRFARADVDGVDISDHAVLSQAGSARRLTLRFYWVDGTLTGRTVVAKWRQAVARLLRRDTAAAVVVASSPYRDDPAAAAEALREFLAALYPFPRKPEAPTN